MNWYFCVFGILALLAQNSAFLFDPPIPTPTNLVAITSSNVDLLLKCAQDVIKCVEPFQRFFNASDPQSVVKIDSEAVVNFTCSAEGEKMMLCIANITGCDSVTRQALPALEQNREFCRNNRSVLHATTKCQSKFLASDAWLNCMETGATNKQSHPGGDLCGAIQGSFDCYYKYVNLVCPEHWAFFEPQFGSADVGNCNITIGTSLTATKCDDKMNLTCLTGRPDDHDTDRLVDFYCSEAGHQSKDCLDRFDVMCSPNNIVKDTLWEALEIPNHADFLCHGNKADYKKFLKCADNLANDTNFMTCMRPVLADPYLDYSSCSYQLDVKRCVDYSFVLSTDCYISMDFYDKLLNYVDSQHLLNCTLGGPTLPPSNASSSCNNVSEACFGGVPLNETYTLVDYVCRPDWKSYVECLHVNCPGINTNILNDDQIKLLCKNSQVPEGYKQFAACMQHFIRHDTTYRTCGPDTSDGNVTCSDLQQTYDCVAASVVKNCPSVLPFFNDIGAKIYDLALTPHCHVHPFSAATLRTPTMSTPFPLFTMPPLNLSYTETFSTEVCANLTAACMSGVDPNNTRVSVDYFCRSGGRPFSDCIRQQCGNDTHGLPNIDQLGVMCQDKAGFVRFGDCRHSIVNDPAVKNCTATEHMPVTLAEQCSSVQLEYDCISRAFATACPSSAPDLYTYMSLSDYGQRCHIRPFTHHVAPRSLLSVITELLIGEDTEE